MITINLWTVLQVVLILLIAGSGIGTVLFALSKPTSDNFSLLGVELIIKMGIVIIGGLITCLLVAVYGGLFWW